MHATPEELKARAREHVAEWRRLLSSDPRAASEELDKAHNLATLASEAEAAMGGEVGR